MTTYGYRLYSLELRKGFGQRPQDFSTCSSGHFIDLMPKLLGRLSETKVGKPVLRGSLTPTAGSEQEESDQTEGSRGESALRIEDPVRNEWAITGSIHAGIFGDHEIALGQPGRTTDADLLDRAPVRRHRFVIVFPEVGERAILAMEAIGRSCPTPLFTSWISKASQEETLDNPSEDGKTSDWWRLIVADQLADQEHLDQLIRSGRFSTVELVKHETTPDRKRTKEKFRLTAPHVEKSLAADLAGVTRRWIENKRSTQSALTPNPASDTLQSPEAATANLKAEGAKQLAAIVANGAQAIDFDDGWILLEDEAGRTNKISPTRLAEVFTYTLSVDDRVSDIAFFRATRARARRIGPSAQIHVDWPAVNVLGVDT